MLTKGFRRLNNRVHRNLFFLLCLFTGTLALDKPTPASPGNPVPVVQPPCLCISPQPTIGQPSFRSPTANHPSSPATLPSPLHLFRRAAAGAAGVSTQEMIRMQYPNSDVKEVLALYERLTQKKLVYDNTVQGPVNIVISTR